MNRCTRRAAAEVTRRTCGNAHLPGPPPDVGGYGSGSQRPVRPPSNLPALLIAGLLAAWLARGAEPATTFEHARVPGERIEGRVDAAAGTAVLEFRGKPLAVYAFAGTQFKPYLRALYTLRGENVLRDAPPDHLHHHGLMHAVRVNGVNFWEENAVAGRQVPVAPPQLDLEPGPGGIPRAVLTQEVRWQPAGGETAESALLREQRRLTITVDTGIEEVAVEWDARFEAGPAAERVVVHGADYHGLGARLPEGFDHVAQFANSNGLGYTEAQTWDVRPAAWTSAAGAVEGREVMVVLAAAPGNPGNSTFFTMRNAFAYVAATQSLGRDTLTYRRGEGWRLRYLFLVYPAHQNGGFLTRRLVPWLDVR